MSRINHNATAFKGKAIALTNKNCIASVTGCLELLKVSILFNIQLNRIVRKVAKILDISSWPFKNVKIKTVYKPIFTKIPAKPIAPKILNCLNNFNNYFSLSLIFEDVFSLEDSGSDC